MLYNLKISTRFDFRATHLKLLNDAQLSKFISNYEQGDSSFFHQGKEYHIGDIYEIKIRDISKTKYSTNEEDYVANFISETEEKPLTNSEEDGLFKRIGINVTGSFITGSFGHLKKEDHGIKAAAGKIEYVNKNRLDELKQIDKSKYDLSKLIRLSDELNTSNQNGNWFAVGALLRAILDHVPPIFGFKNFSEVANNFSSPGKAKSFKDSMKQLDKSMRKISDSYLHSHITKTETLPNETQVGCKRDLDRLLEELVRILKTV